MRPELKHFYKCNIFLCSMLIFQRSVNQKFRIMFDIKIYVVATFDVVSISTSCSHPVNGGQMGNETWCLPVILTVKDMRVLTVMLVSVPGCYVVRFGEQFQTFSRTITPSSSGSIIYPAVTVFRAYIYLLYEFCFIFTFCLNYSHIFSPSARIFPPPSTLLGTYTDSTQSQGSHH